MKKFLFALVCVAALALTSCGGGNDPTLKDLSTCDNTVERCYELICTAGGVTESTYIWCTEWVIVYTLQESQKLVGNLGKYSYKEAPSAKTEEACDELDRKYGAK